MLVPRQQYKHCFDDREEIKAPLAFTDTQPLGRDAAPSHAFIIEKVIRTICENFISFASITMTVAFKFAGRYTIFYNWILPLRLSSRSNAAVASESMRESMKVASDTGARDYKVRDGCLTWPDRA